MNLSFLTKFTTKFQSNTPFAKSWNALWKSYPVNTDVEPMLIYCWTTVCHAGPTINQPWLNVCVYWDVFGHMNEPSTRSVSDVTTSFIMPFVVCTAWSAPPATVAWHYHTPPSRNYCFYKLNPFMFCHRQSCRHAKWYISCIILYFLFIFWAQTTPWK